MSALESLISEFLNSTDPVAKTRLLEQASQEMEKQGISRKVDPKKIAARIAQMKKELS